MPNADDIRWFKQQFQAAIAAALKDTPFDIDMIIAIACQETGPTWSRLRRNNLSLDRILALCVGDTLDAPNRGAFPQTKADLVARPRGQEMFEIARKALVEMAEHIPEYRGAAARPNKFCHGYGVFQRDLQFFLEDPDYFLNRDYERFDATLAHCLAELGRGLKKLGFTGRESLSDFEFASVAIAYNTGRFVPSRGLKQGFFNGERFYGEEVFDFIRLSRTVAVPGATPAIAPPADNQAILPPPAAIEGSGDMVVDTMLAPLRVRSEPEVTDPPSKNVVAHLPDGHPVRTVTGRKVRGFLEIETMLQGAHVRGFASAKFLVPATAPVPIPAALAAPTPVPAPGPAPGPAPAQAGTPAAATAAGAIPAVFMPRKPGSVTRRAAEANAHSLNEPNQPARAGATPGELVASLNAIIDWLAVEKPQHLRYQPRAGLTFCNIYAHDFCHLAGVYVPRVWWSGRALLDLAAGKPVAPLIGDSIHEMRANDLFRWLRDFGESFGWRRTTSLDELQQAANQGGIGLIVARRKEDGRSGHIVMVIAEGEADRARRDSSGQVIAPLQSQAGMTNFARGTGKLNWFKGEEFAESAFWMHA